MLKSGADVYKYLGYIGFFGFLITTAEFFILDEMSDINPVEEDLLKLAGSLIGFVALGSLNSYISPFYYRRSNALLMNLSLLSIMLWAYLVDQFVFNLGLQPMYYLVFAFNLFAILLYTWVKPKSKNDI